jgi:hypothetical protein
MRIAINRHGVVAFGVASGFSLTQGWSLPEFCWSTWLAGLVYTWACIVTALIQIIFTARSKKLLYEERFPLIMQISPLVFLLGTTGLRY